MYGAEKVISAINAVTCINGDLSECRYEDIRIIFQENFIVKNSSQRNLQRFTNTQMQITASTFSL